MASRFEVNNKMIFVIPAILAVNPDISDSAKILYCIIRQLSYKSGYCYASNSYLASAVGKSEVSVSRNIKALKKFRYLKVIYSGKYYSGRKIYIVPVSEIPNSTELIRFQDVLDELSSKLTLPYSERKDFHKNSTSDSSDNELDRGTLIKNDKPIVKNDWHL